MGGPLSPKFTLSAEGGLQQQLAGDGSGPSITVTWIGPGPNPGHQARLILKTSSFREADATSAEVQIHL